MTDKTLDFYARNAETYAAQSRPSPRLAAFLRLLAPESHILELGTGSGRDAAEMLRAGFRVDATDGSPELARFAERLIGQPVRILLFTELDAEGVYDAVYANASLLHAPRHQLPDIIDRIYKALKPGGHVWASFKAGEAEGEDRLGRRYNYLSRLELEELWRNNGPWEQIRVESWQGGAYDGQPTEWLAVIARRPA